jgi:hypothetical protein
MQDQNMNPKRHSRRAFLAGGAAGATLLAAPPVFASQDDVRRNLASFRVHDWRDHWDELGAGVILSDTMSRMLQHWDANERMTVYPTSVPMTDELTRRGHTEVVRKKVAPSWTPTANMRERDPSLPQRIEGGAPNNPLGTHALYLTWPAYLIHGTHDTRKIGRRSSSGCIGLYNQQIAELFSRVPVGVKVRLI